LRGTIAMAKLAAPADGGPPNGGPNSATSEWFFNLSNTNPGTCPLGLDCQNGGYTVFGRVLGTGMTVVDAIAALQRFDLDPPPAETFDTVPLRTGTTLADRLVYLTNVQILSLAAGDYNRNGIVDAADYNVWRTNFGSTTDAGADGNGDGRVDMADLVVWRNTLGHTSGSGASAGLGLSTVPEPSAAFLLLIGSAILATRRRRRR
jgi:peptidyl-prolyl cis-trans isomerase A (cyclophilin A)